MELKGIPGVKICCISSREEAELAIAYGTAVLGLG
jgi:phosphoribosylanthranilate isomerase